MKNLETTNQVEIEPREESLIEIGQWYWIKEDSDSPKYKEYQSTIQPHPGYPWLACVSHVGSNYANVKSPGLDGSSTSERIHFNDFEDKTIFEPNPKEIINQNKNQHKNNVNKYMLEIKNITALLGVSQQEKLSETSSSGETALAVQSSNQSAKEYKNQLTIAKEESLPELFEKIKKENKHVVKWMTSETMGLESAVNSLKGCLRVINKRILNVTLYTGITEQIIHVKEGEPALFSDKIHLMQRRLYMDEECLLEYRAGGMEFKNIEEFDNWISDKNNFKRILPFPKCIVTFRVRRNTKDRLDAENIPEAYVKIRLEKADKLTYMYIRNGDNLYRLDTELQFGEKIFPDMADFDPSVPMMISPCSNETIPLSRWEVEKSEHEERIKNCIKWEKDHPFKEWVAANPFDNAGNPHLSRQDEWAYNHANPYTLSYGWDNEKYDKENWELFSKENVRYDDVLETITDQVDQYNRIALIVQGILDRSEILHPHPPIEAGKESDFQSMIKLIYDGGAVLYNGDPPDILEYINHCNISAGKDSVFIGQLEYYMIKQARIENDKNDRSYYSRNHSDYKVFLPYNDPGADYVSKCKHFTKTGKAIFEWYRQRRTYDHWNNAPIKVRVTVPIDKLFNVSAYKPGDFKRFFNDPRTRQNYLKWAPLLLAAEDWHAGIVRDNHGNKI